MNLRIAVLLTNDDASAFAAEFPNDGQKVVDLLQLHRPHWIFDVVPVKDGVLPPSPDAFDGYVITGSPASVNDEKLVWLGPFLDFIRQVDAAKQPLIGLCFGHQAVARALGGQVSRHPEGWGLGAATTHWQKSSQWMQPALAATTLMAAHNEQVTQMPEGALCLGGSDFCTIGSMQMGQHIWTTQYHPEMPLKFMQALLLYLTDKLDAHNLENANTSLSNVADAPMFGRWMVQFIEHARDLKK
jgi:GMP synthase-like glutamine amidotransferase